VNGISIYRNLFFVFLGVTGSLYVSLFSGRGHRHSLSTYSGVPIVVFAHPLSTVNFNLRIYYIMNKNAFPQPLARPSLGAAEWREPASTASSTSTASAPPRSVSLGYPNSDMVGDMVGYGYGGIYEIIVGYSRI